MSTAYALPNSAIVYECLEDEIIIANLDSGVYYSIRECGVPIWKLLIAGQSVEAIASLLQARFGADLSESLYAFLRQITEENLLTAGAPSPKPLVEEISWPPSFTPPSLEKYEEMKELLMLDPVHEVDAQGWPSAPAK